MRVSQGAARSSRWRWSRFFYMLTAALLLFAGAFSMVNWDVFFGVGRPLLGVSLVLLLLIPFEAKPRIIWPAFAAAVGFILAFIAMIPVYCLFSDPPTCYSVIGYEYRDLYGPAPVRPQLVASAMAAAFAWASAFLLVWFRQRRETGNRQLDQTA